MHFIFYAIIILHEFLIYLQNFIFITCIKNILHTKYYFTTILNFLPFNIFKFASSSAFLKTFPPFVTLFQSFFTSPHLTRFFFFWVKCKFSPPIASSFYITCDIYDVYQPFTYILFYFLKIKVISCVYLLLGQKIKKKEFKD